MRSCLLFCLLLSLCVPLWALVPPSGDDYTLRTSLDRSVFVSSADPANWVIPAGPAWSEFIRTHAPVKVLRNPYFNEPYRVIAKPISLAGFDRIDDQNVSAFAWAFIREYRELLGIQHPEELVLESAEFHGGLWFIIFKQNVAGLDVRWGRVDIRAGSDGRVRLWGANVFQGIDPTWAASNASVGADRLESAARTGIPDASAPSKSELGTRCILPVENEGGIAYHRCREVVLKTVDPPGKWRCLVDEESGALLRRINDYHFATAYMTGEIYPIDPTGTPVSYPLPYADITKEGATFYTDSTGLWVASDLNNGNILTSVLRGRYFRIVDSAGTNPSLRETVTGDPMELVFDDSNSDFAERTAFFWTTQTMLFIKGYDPGFTAMDRGTRCAVNENNTCNAFWDGTGVNFFREGDGCANTGMLRDVIAHETTHGITQNQYGTDTCPGDMHEAFSDYIACTWANTPGVARGFFGAGSTIRNLNNRNHYPEDVTGEVHNDGLIIGGAFWSTRTYMGNVPRTDSLVHFSKYGHPESFEACMWEMVAFDDDDGDLTNGTPNYCAILQGFWDHGIGPGANPQLIHTPLGNRADVVAPLRFECGVTNACPTSAYQIVRLVLHYNLGSGEVAAEMRETIPSVYQTIVPGPGAPCLVRYWIEALDSFGAVSQVLPEGAPYNLYTFMLGAHSWWFDDFEIDRGWSLRATTDDAVRGFWVRTDPHGSYYNGDSTMLSNPDDDHTPGGVRCLVTADVVWNPDSGAGQADVDYGTVTATSPTLDLTTTRQPVLEYWYWNVSRLVEDDTLAVDITSDNGAHWVNVGKYGGIHPEWRVDRVFLRDHIDLTSQFKIRVHISDDTNNSQTEGAFDDVYIYDFNNTGVALDAKSLPGSNLGVSPTVFRDRFTVTLRGQAPVDRPARLTLYDPLGRCVARLWEGPLQSGTDLQLEISAGELQLAPGAYLLRFDESDRGTTHVLFHLSD